MVEFSKTDKLAFCEHGCEGHELRFEDVSGDNVVIIVEEREDCPLEETIINICPYWFAHNIFQMDTDLTEILSIKDKWVK